MSDVLAPLSPPELAGFYRRLAQSVEARKGSLEKSFAAMLLNHWLDNRKPDSVFEPEAPRHVQNHAKGLEVLAYHRAVYLTEQKARLGPGVSRWAGIVPRLQGVHPYQKWDLRRPLMMDYQSLVEIPLRYQITGDDADRDILYALHGYQLKSYVIVSGVAVPGSTKVKIAFQSFEAQINDRYDWDYSEHLTVPNPDYRSKAPGAVAPESDTVKVYHKHALRLEQAGLAAPYDLRTRRWKILAPTLAGPAVVDAAKSVR